MKRFLIYLAERLTPFTVIASYNTNAKTPGWMREFLRFTFRGRLYVIGKKIKNIQVRNIRII